MDKAESIDSGHGKLDLGIGLFNGTAIGSISAEAKINKALSAYGQAWARYTKAWEAGAVAGIRYRW